MKQTLNSLILLAFVTGASVQVMATHPTEGVLSPEALMQEALANNPAIKAAKEKVKAIEARYRSNLGAFAPELSIEGGPLAVKFDEETHSGTAVYGKAEWNLYRGGKDSAERAKRGTEKTLAKSQLEQIKAEVARDVARVYYEMAFILESIAIQERGLELNREQTRLAHAKKSAGFTSQADVIEFELRDATIRSDLQELRQEREMKSRELSVLLGRSEPSSHLAVKGHLQRRDSLPDKENLIRSISDFNLDVLRAKSELEISKAETTIARSGFLPTVDFQSRYGKLANDGEVFSENDNYSVGVVVNIPLFSGFSTKNDVVASSSKTAAREFEVGRKLLAARAEAETLFGRLETIQTRLDLEERTLSRSEEYYKITLEEYRKGVKNSPDMVGASERLLNSRIRNLEFRRDYQISLLQLLGLVGAGPADEAWAMAEETRKSTMHEKELKPGEIHEECMKLRRSQELSYFFSSNLPLDFNIHYHVGENVEFPVKKDAIRQVRGVFKPSFVQDYCLMWTNISKEPTTIRYEFRVTEAGDK